MREQIAILEGLASSPDTDRVLASWPKGWSREQYASHIEQVRRDGAACVAMRDTYMRRVYWYDARIKLAQRTGESSAEAIAKMASQRAALVCESLRQHKLAALAGMMCDLGNVKFATMTLYQTARESNNYAAIQDCERAMRELDHFRDRLSSTAAKQQEVWAHRRNRDTKLVAIAERAILQREYERTANAALPPKIEQLQHTIQSLDGSYNEQLASQAKLTPVEERARSEALRALSRASAATALSGAGLGNWIGDLFSDVGDALVGGAKGLFDTIVGNAQDAACGAIKSAGAGIPFGSVPAAAACGMIGGSGGGSKKTGGGAQQQAGGGIVFQPGNYTSQIPGLTNYPQQQQASKSNTPLMVAGIGAAAVAALLMVG